MNAPTEALKWTAPPLPEYEPLIAESENENGRGATQPNSDYQNSQNNFTAPTENVPSVFIDGREVDPTQQVNVFPAPATQGYYGASEAGWEIMANLVGSKYLLPTVCNPNLWNARGFQLKNGELQRVLGGGSLAKTPSAINGSGKLHGIQGWQLKEPTDLELKQWSQNRDLGILVRTNKARALDIDSGNPETVAAILEVVARHFGEDRWSHTPIRWRDNSSRKTLLFIVEEPVSKQAVPIRVALRDPSAEKEEAYELLGDGQQTLWAGTHPSGARLQHSQLDAARGLPVVTLTELEALWAELATRFAADAVTHATLQKGHGAALMLTSDSNDPVAEYLLEQGYAREAQAGKVHVDCPWQEHHASSGGTTPVGSASWLLPGVDADGKTMHGRFNCKHSSCKGHGSGRLADETSDRGLTERFLEAVGFRSAEIAASFPAVPAPVDQFSANPEPNVIPFPGAPSPVGLGVPAGTWFDVLTEEEFHALPPASFMVQDVLPYEGVCMVYGQSGAGKTFLVLDLIMHLMNGSSDWFGNQIHDRPAGVLYVVLEDASGVGNRGKAWKQNHATPAKNVHYITGQQLNLASTEHVDGIISAALRTVGKGCMVIIDTQAQATVGSEEQSAKEMGVIYSNLHKISRAVGGIVMPIAHSGKDDTKGARGSSAQYAACDVVMSVKDQGGARAWSIEKSKLDVAGKPGHFTLERTVIGKHPVTGADLPSGYVLPRNAPSQAKELKGNDLLVLEAFKTTAALVDDIPVQEGAWRQNFKALCGQKKPNVTTDAIEKAFKRGRDLMLGRNLVTEANGGFRLGFGIAGAFEGLPKPNASGGEGDTS